MKFSIIVVSYNAGSKLKYTIDSCINQTYNDFEIIIKDSCSQDDSTSFLNAFYDKRIKLVQKKDFGIYDGMNQAIDIISGDLVIFMNCGDRFYDNHILAKVASMIHEKNNNVIYFGDCYVENRGGIVHLPQKWDDYCCYRFTICHQAMFYSAKYLKRFRFNTKNTISACITHYIEAYARHGVKLIHLPLIVCCYEGGGVSDTPEGRKKSLDAQYKMLKQCFGSKHFIFMLRMFLSGQLIKQRISTIPYFRKAYEKAASYVYSRRKNN